MTSQAVNTRLRPGRHPRKAYNVIRDEALTWPGCPDCGCAEWRHEDGVDGPVCTFNKDWAAAFRRYFNPPVPYHEFHHAVHSEFGLPCDADCREPQPPKDYEDGASLIEKIKSAVTVEDIGGRLTTLRGHGERMRGPCPFHKEQRGQSFTVYVDSQSWYCFGQCAQGGDVVDLLRLAEEQGLTWR